MNHASDRRVFLAQSPERGAPRLAEEDLHHALHVLRVVPGDELLGLDGRGGAWPLVVAARGRRELLLEPAGEPRREPPPGEPGSPLPRVEVALSLPRGGRAEDMLDRLTQLGLASLCPLVCERSPAHAREAGPQRLARLERVAREACKQAVRLWPPEVSPPVSLAAWLERAGGARVALDPRGSGTLAEWAREARSGGERDLRLVVGPEGGFSEDEQHALGAAGVPVRRLAPHVLRVETAAELACGLVVHAWLE